MATGLIAVIGVFSSIILAIYLFFKTRHKERIDLIQSGQSADIFATGKANRIQFLKWGIIIVFIGLGILLGGMLEQMEFLEDGFAGFFAVLVLGGIGMILFYFIAGRIDDDE